MEQTFSLVVKQYERLLEAVVDTQEKGKLLKTCETLKQVISEDLESWHLLCGGRWSLSTQMHIMNNILNAIQACETLRRFVTLLIQNRRLSKLLPILSSYEETLQRAGREVVLLKTARPLSQEKIQEMQDTLSKVLPKEALLRYINDPSLLGGAIILWRDFMIDDTIKTRLHTLKT